MPRTKSLKAKILELLTPLAENLANAIKDEIASGAPSTGAKTPSRAAAPKRVARAASGRSRRLTDADLDLMVRAVGSFPGLRSEQLYGKVELPPKLAKAALARLRAQKRVKTKGEKRATTYLPAKR